MDDVLEIERPLLLQEKFDMIRRFRGELIGRVILLGKVPSGRRRSLDTAPLVNLCWTVNPSPHNADLVLIEVLAYDGSMGKIGLRWEEVTTLIDLGTVDLSGGDGFVVQLL